MKPVWKWIIGIVAVLLIAALLVGGFFLVRNVLPMHRVVVQSLNQSQGFGQRGFDNRNFGPEGMMPGFGMRGYGMHGGFGMMGGMLPFGGIFSGLFCLAFLALVVLGIIWLVRRTKTPAPVPQPAAVMHSCQNCGKPVQDDWKNCPYCGKKLKF
jgi:hypothetical protein